MNKSWVSSLGNPSSGIEWAASVSDNSGFTYTTGHIVSSGLLIELYLIKKDKLGNTIWEETFNLGAGTKSYGVALALDGNNLYIVGATFNGTNGNHDYLVLKYDTSGNNVWSYTYNGPDNGEDIPSSLIYDADGNIYVTGASYGNTTNYDYLTLKLSASGILSWAKRYDHNGFRDGASHIQIDPSGEIAITGASENTANVWDYAILKYDHLNGTLIQEKRFASGIIGLDIPLGFTADDNGYFYLTGYGTNGSGTDNDIYTVKMDDQLNIIWEKFFGASDLNDAGQDVVLDNGGNIYVCGYSEKTNGGSNFTLIKYDQNGNELWSKQRASVSSQNPVQARYIKIDALGNIILTGEETNGNNSFIKTVSYSPDGQLLWEDDHDGDPNAIEKPLGITTLSDGSVLVSTHIKQTPLGGYQLINYEQENNPIAFDYDAENNPTNVDGEIIVRFNPQVLDSTFVDNTDLIYGIVSDLVADQALINQMDQELDGGLGRVSKWKVQKIFSFLNTTTISSLNRFGEPVYIPSLWSAYILKLENGMDEMTAANILSGFDYRDILYAEPNFTYKVNASPLPPPPPDDSLYVIQHSLNSTTFPNAHINIEPVWDQGITGTESVKVGVVDTGVSFHHEDFGGGTNPNNYGGINGSVISEGFDFTTSGTFEVMTESDTENDYGSGHGTRMASIIGALRNNNRGISGIAGGDLATGTRGVDFKIFKAGGGPAGTLTSTNAGAGIALAALNGIPLVDILNNSYGGPSFFGTSGGEEGQFLFMKDVLEPTYKSGTIMLYSRGNEADDAPHPPGTLDDKWMITVGASGFDGRLKVEENSVSGTTQEDLYASFGRNMDIIAPGTNALIVSLNNLEPGNDFICPDPSFFDDNVHYACSNGSSSATAHATGVSALILEHHREQYGIDLTHEDIEALLSFGATDVVDQNIGIPQGYEDQNGWGLLNASGSIDLISNNQKIIHVDVIPNLDSTIIQADWELTRDYHSPDQSYNNDGIFPGNILMIGNILKYSAPIALDICALGADSIIPIDESLEKYSAWINNSRSDLWGIYQGSNDPMIEIASVIPEDSIFWEEPPIIQNNGCVLNGRISGYAYNPTIINNQPVEETQIIPPIREGQNHYRINFSLLISDSNNTIQDGEIIIDTTTDTYEAHQEEQKIKIFPNPANNRINIQTYLRSNTNVILEVYDIQGRLLRSKDINNHFGAETAFSLDISALTSGLYLLRLKNKDFTAIEPFIKN